MIRTFETLTLAEASEFVSEEARRQGADRFDIVADELDRMRLDVFDGKVTKTELSNWRGIGIRFFRGKRLGCSFTERLTCKVLRRAVDSARGQLGLTGEVDVDLPQPALLPLIDLQLCNPALESLSLHDMKAFGLRLERAAFGADARVRNVPHLRVVRERAWSIVSNSNGVFYQSRQGSILAELGVVAEDGDSRKMSFYSLGSRALDYDAEVMAHKAVERAVELLGGTPVPSGVYPLVFSHRISPQLFSMFASPFFAETAQNSQSRLQGKMGCAIAAPEFTLVSDPFIPSAPGSYLFDGEGVTARIVEVVRRGVLQTYLYNLESAKKAGVPPTGTGSRGHSGQSETHFANYRVQKGYHNLDDLLAVYPRCLYLVQLEGAAACSPVSGEISIGAQGFLYEKGQRVRPVDRVTINTNFFDLLLGIRGLSNSYSDAFSRFAVPDVLVEEVHVSG